MKADIHPNLNICTVVCACGETFQTLSILSEFRVEICHKCHPFFTGKQKFIDTAGRVEKFQKKVDVAQTLKAAKAAKEKQGPPTPAPEGQQTPE